MILQALVEYYNRKGATPESDIAPPGFEWKEIPFVVVLSLTGNVVAINDTREGEGKKKTVKRFLVPQSVKKTSGINSNLLWENCQYALGIPQADKEEKPERIKEAHNAFKSRIHELSCKDDPGVIALIKFLEGGDKVMLLQGYSALEELQKNANISFSLAGDHYLISERPAVHAAIYEAANREVADGSTSICLVTGENQHIERLHSSIKGVRGAQSSGANIVSFNSPAFCSFAKEQGNNAPVGKEAAFKYTTALNALLSKDSMQKLQVADATTVFWAERPVGLENAFRDIFDEAPKDDPARSSEAVRAVYAAATIGALPPAELETFFYVLGLSPNASRLAVRFWYVDTVQGLASHIKQHLDDIRIVKRESEAELLSLYRLLGSIKAEGKSAEVPPNLAGEFMRAILQGLPYPRTLLSATIRRIRAKREVNYPRAALIKACLNRETRFFVKGEKEMLMSLDETNENPGYCLGRLFAVLEKIQTEASPGINATIRDKFYGAASSTPVAVFGSLLRMKNHHLAKLDNAGRRIFFEKRLGDVVSKISDFPAHLSLADQGRFAIGYYHENAWFYTPRENSK